MVQTTVISIIDDDKPLREALQRMLASYGFDTRAFGSAKEFLVKEKNTRSACIILDVRMPEMSGMALLEYCNASGWIIPTILITACPTETERDRAFEKGAVSYLSKPLSEEILVDTIRRTLENGRPAAETILTERLTPGI